MRPSVVPLLILFQLLSSGETLHFLGNLPVFAHSHVTFLSKLTDSLTEAGHDVTLIAPIIELSLFKEVQKTKAKIISIPQSKEAAEFDSTTYAAVRANLWKLHTGVEFYRQVQEIYKIWQHQCDATLSHHGLIEVLKGEHFDAAFSEPLDPCGFALFYQLGIKKSAAVLSISSIDGFYSLTGAPTAPSCEPETKYIISCVIANFGDRMTFNERLWNTINSLFAIPIKKSFLSPFTAIFRKHYGPQFPEAQDVLDNASLVFSNSQPLIDFPRVITRKVIDIGGITVSQDFKKTMDLNQTWSDILARRKRNVLISFGSVVQSCLMPPEYKKTIRETFRSFPDITFIWKYECPEDKISNGIDNIIESTWVPQVELLCDPRLSLFITHCGIASLTESTTIGVPLVVIPVMADQTRNAQVVKHAAMGVVISKDDLAGGDGLAKALTEVLNNRRYKENALRIGRMLKDAPITPRELFVRNMEFLAKHGPLRQLDHYGRHLTFIQFYLIDVISFLFLISVTIVVIVFLIGWAVMRKCFCTPRKEKLM